MRWFIFVILLCPWFSNAWADPPSIASISKCPPNTESPKKGICCRKGLSTYGGLDNCVFHGPIVYGDLSQNYSTIITYEYGRLMGPRWEIVDRRIQSVQNYDDSVAVGPYQEFDRDGQLFLEGSKDQGQLTGLWKVHFRNEQKTYRISLAHSVDASPLEICSLGKDDCQTVTLPSQEEVRAHRESIERIVGFYKAHEALHQRYFETPRTAFLPLRLSAGSKGRLLGVVIENRLVTGWDNFHPFTYLDKDAGYVPIAKKDNGTCLVQMLPSPLPWVWIPCPNKIMDLNQTILSYQWIAPGNPTSIELSPKGDSSAELQQVREIVAAGMMSVKPTRILDHQGQQWIEGTLTDFATDLKWEVLPGEAELRKKLKVQDHVGTKVQFPLIFGNELNFLPLAHN